MFRLSTVKQRLDDDKIVITFNWKDGTKTVTLAELEAATKNGGGTAETGKDLQINDFECSHLDGNRPPERKRQYC